MEVGRWGWTDAAVCSREQTGRVCVFLCVCVGGGGTQSKPMGVYIMFYGYGGTHKSLFH